MNRTETAPGRLRAEAANIARLIAYPFAAVAVTAYGIGCVIAAETGRKIRGRRDEPRRG